jgi:hypothetical protein
MATGSLGRRRKLPADRRAVALDRGQLYVPARFELANDGRRGTHSRRHDGLTQTRSLALLGQGSGELDPFFGLGDKSGEPRILPGALLDDFIEKILFPVHS